MILKKIQQQVGTILAALFLSFPAFAQSSGPIQFDTPENKQIARLLKQGYLLLSAEIELKNLNSKNTIIDNASKIDLDCQSGRSSWASSTMSYALGIKLASPARTPATATTVDLLSGAITPEPLVPIAYVIDLDKERCNWNYHTVVGMGAARISDIGERINANVLRLTSQSDNPQFIGLFIQAAESLMPFGSTASVAKKLMLDADEQLAAKKIQEIFSNFSRSGSIHRYPLSWKWRSHPGQRQLAYYSRKFSDFATTPADRKVFVVKVHADPAISLFDADYEIANNRIVPKYNFQSNPLNEALGTTTAQQRTVKLYLDNDDIARGLMGLLRRADVSPELFGETCSKLKDAIQARFGLIDDDTAFVMHAILKQTRWRNESKLRTAGCPDEGLVQSINRLLVQSGQTSTVEIPNAAREKTHELGDLIDRIAAAGRSGTDRARFPAYEHLLDDRVTMLDSDKVFAETGTTPDKAETAKALARHEIQRMACHVPGSTTSEVSTFGILAGSQPKRFEASLRAIITPDEPPSAKVYRLQIKELRADAGTKTRLRSVRDTASAACNRFIETEFGDLL